MPTTTPLPPWLKKRLVITDRLSTTAAAVRSVATVCAASRCPNLHECFSHGHVTFLIMGDVCTRRCGFCAVTPGVPQAPDPAEPERIARAVRTLAAKDVVITSVTRDDLPDGGAAHFAAVARAVHSAAPTASIELLIPDFQGSRESLASVLAAPITICAHNMETVRRIFSLVRPIASYDRSLEVLAQIKKNNSGILSKSGIMVGLGESDKEVFQTLDDMRAAGVDQVTIGQYLCPGRGNHAVDRYVPPQTFARYRSYGAALGFSRIVAGPFVRSSYRLLPADE